MANAPRQDAPDAPRTRRPDLVGQAANGAARAAGDMANGAAKATGDIARGTANGVAKATGDVAKGAGDVAKQAAQGFDITRPFRLMYKFFTGTVVGGLDGMATWGARGFQMGGILGLVAAFATGTVGMIGIGIIAGTLGGMALGATFGLLTGGATRAARQQAREDAAAARGNGRQQGFMSHGPLHSLINDSNFDRQLQQNQELEREQNYWQDRINGTGMGQGRSL